MCGQAIKTQVKDRIIMKMKEYLDIDTIQILETVIVQEFSKLNIEEITTLPAKTRNSIDEQNKYIIDLFRYKKRALKKGTKVNYLNAIKRLITLIYKPLTQIDDMDIFNYLQWYEQRNMGTTGKKNNSSTMNNERLFLSAFFSWMRKERLRPDNPVETIEKKKVIRKPIDYFKKDEMAKLRDACRNPRDRALVEVFRSTGARVNEITPITLDMIDWTTGDIEIQGEKSDRYRAIWLDVDARHYLKKYLDTRNDSNPHMFVHSRGRHEQLHAEGIRAVMRKLRERAKIKDRVYPHKYRKTLGMSLKNRGVDIGIIQEVMGHASPAVTAMYYAQSTPETLRRVREGCVA